MPISSVSIVSDTPAGGQDQMLGQGLRGVARDSLGWKGKARALPGRLVHLLPPPLASGLPSLPLLCKIKSLWPPGQEVDL